MTDMPGKVAIVPCSGIGKTFGTVSRVAAYRVTEDDRPEKTRLVSLAMLVMGDLESRNTLAESPAITIDGCSMACATKMVGQCGGRIAREFAVLEVFRRYHDFKPQGIAELNESGEKLADALAKEIDIEIDNLTSHQERGHHA